MSRIEDPHRHPIGYWLKRLDDLINQGMNEVLGDNGLTRNHWQVLNLAHENDPTTRLNLADKMKTFVDDEALDEIITNLETREWIFRRDREEPRGTEIKLTEEGQAGHVKISEIIGAFRARTREGISDEEYLTVIGVLSRMAANIETSQATE